MWRSALLVLLKVTLAQPLWGDEDPVITAQDCSLDCIRQGGASCQYCRISRQDMKETLGLNSVAAFGSCVPWPCLTLLGDEDPQICQHYVKAPTDVKVEVVPDTENPAYDTVVVSWKPSPHGIAFLRGFQVSLQALGGSGVACQLFLFNRNRSLPASHAQMVYESDPFPGLALGSQYAVSVMALPVPEQWERFYNSRIYSTRSCAEKMGLEKCKKDWYPEHVQVQQEETMMSVTFNLAPLDLGIRSYFLLCYANGVKTYTEITPDFATNQTHHTFQIKDLQEGTNYTCEIAANEVDAVRRTFSVQVKRNHKETAPTRTPSLALALVLPLTLAVFMVLLIAGLTFNRTKAKLQLKKLHVDPDIILQCEGAGAEQQEVMSLPMSRTTPPRLLICYSSRDGAAHVKAVMQLGAFIQQHMATKVSLDLWDSLTMAQEGSVAWHCRHIRDCDFVLVVCSRGLHRRGQRSEPEDEQEEEEEAATRLDCCTDDAFSSDAAVQLIGEEVGRAKARGQDLSKFMAAIFEYSEETDIPSELRLVSQYTLTADMPLLFSHIHRVALHRPGRYLKVSDISEEGFSKLPAGVALQAAIHEAGMAARGKRPSSVRGLV